MTNQITDTIDAAVTLLAQVRVLATPPPDTRVYVPSGSNLQAAIDAAPDWATLALAPGIYEGTVTMPRPLALEPVADIPPGRAIESANGVWINGSAGIPKTLDIFGHDVAVRGIGIKSANPTANLVVFTGERMTLDRCTALGGVNGAHRGILLNGAGADILQCYIDEIWQKGTEAQAICGYDGTKDVLVDDCHLSGASQSLMLGGSDSLTPDRVPMNIRVRRSLLTKKLAWLAKGALLKTALEAKSVIGLHVSDCELENAGTSEGQGGYLIVLKALNQNGSAPWTRSTGILIERSTGRNAAGCISFVGNDGAFASETLASVTVRDMEFFDIDPALYPGPGRAFTFSTSATGGGAIDVTIERVKVHGKNMAAAVYFATKAADTATYRAPRPVRLKLRDVQLPPSPYGLKIENSGIPSALTPAAMVAALKTWAPDAVVEQVTVS